MQRTVQRVSAVTPQCLVSFTVQHAWGLLPEAGLPSFSPHRVDICQSATQANGSRGSTWSSDGSTIIGCITSPSLSNSTSQGGSYRTILHLPHHSKQHASTRIGKPSTPISSIGFWVSTSGASPSVQPSKAASLTIDTSPSYLSAIPPWHLLPGCERSSHTLRSSCILPAGALNMLNARSLHTSFRKETAGSLTGAAGPSRRPLRWKGGGDGHRYSTMSVVDRKCEGGASLGGRVARIVGAIERGTVIGKDIDVSRSTQHQWEVRVRAVHEITHHISTTEISVSFVQ